MKDFTFYVKGIMYRPKKVIKDAANNLKSGDTLLLERDMNNKFDKYAVKVEHDFTWIGYVESDYSQEVAGLLESAVSFNCEVFFVDVDWDFDITDSGREIEIVEDITLMAEIKFGK